MKLVFFRSEELEYENNKFSCTSSYLDWLEKLSKFYDQVIAINPARKSPKSLRKPIKHSDNLSIEPLPRMNGYFRPFVHARKMLRIFMHHRDADYFIIRIPDHSSLIVLSICKLLSKSEKIIIWKVGDRLNIFDVAISRNEMFYVKFLLNKIYNFFENYAEQKYRVFKNGIGEDSKKCLFIHGCSISSLEAREIVSYSKKEKYKIRYFGRISKEKNLDTIIDAIPFLSKVSIEIVGRCSDEEYLGQLKIKTQKYNNVTFINEIEYGPSLFEMIASSYLVLQPSLSEGASRTVLESLCLEVPVLVSDIKANEDLVKPLPSAQNLIFKRNDPSDLADKINTLISNTDLYSTIESEVKKSKYVYIDDVCNKITNFLS